jgi:hypothetical protein
VVGLVDGDAVDESRVLDQNGSLGERVSAHMVDDPVDPGFRIRPRRTRGLTAR